MTQHIDIYTTNSTITLPSDLVSQNLAVTAIGGVGDFLQAAAYVQGTVPASAFPLTVTIGHPGTANGGAGYSGGGAGYNGGGGSTGVVSGGALIMEAGGGDGTTNGNSPGGSGGGSASNTPPNAGGSQLGAGSGGSAGGTGGNQSGGALTGGAGAGGGTNGVAGSGTTSGAGVGSGGLIVPGRAASFAASTVTGFQYGAAPLDSSGLGSVSVTYNVADAPLAPNTLTPRAGNYADTNANGVTLGGIYRTKTPDTGALVGVAVSLKIDGGTVHYWDGTDFTSTTAVYVTPDTGEGAVNGESFTVVIPPGVLADGHTDTWGLSCQESFANLPGAFSTTQNLITAVAPTVTFTSPSATQTTLTPTISWTKTTPAGSQTNYRFVLYDEPNDSPGTGTAVYDSGVVSGATASFAIPSSTLSSVATYYGYLQITETGGQQTAWTPVVFTVQLVDSATPTLTATVTTEPTSGMPAVELVATTSGGTASPSVRFQALLTDSGWTDVLGLTGGIVTALVPVASGSASLYDVGLPFNLPLQYRCRNEAVSGGETFVSAWSSTVTLADGVPSLYWWMVPSVEPGLAIQLKRIRSTVATSSSSTSDTAVTMPAMPSGLSASLIVDEPEQQGRFNGFGRSTAIVIHGDIWAEEFVLNVYFDGEDDFQAFRAIRNFQAPVLLKSDMSGDTYWVTLGPARPTAILSEANRQADPKRGMSIQCIPSDPVLP